MKKAIILCIFIFMSTYVYCFIPVIDPNAILMEAIKFEAEIAKWEQYLNKFRELKDVFERRLDLYIQTYRALIEGEVKIFLPVQEIEAILYNSPYFLDSKFRDVWRELYFSNKSIIDKYPILTENVMKKNEYFVGNSYFQEVFHYREKLFQEKIFDTENSKKMLADFRFSASDRLKLIREYDRLLKKYSTFQGDEESPVLQEGKLLYLLSMVTLQRMIQMEEALTMVREGYADSLKESTRAAAYYKRLMIYMSLSPEDIYAE